MIAIEFHHGTDAIDAEIFHEHIHRALSSAKYFQRTTYSFNNTPFYPAYGLLEQAACFVRIYMESDAEIQKDLMCRIGTFLSWKIQFVAATTFIQSR